ncbi:hypothetical protein C8Q70DRAFT_1014692 [Cubamyces menziesii]|nr:hypothetical protein C8Q70DRAFT_1014692 [Cubamyces menziesii]
MPPKRALGDDDAALLRDMTSNAAPPRGRKRFAYDLRNASESAAQGVEVCGARLSAISPGEEDGSFDCVITLPDGMPQITVSVLVSDTSEYPTDHTFFCSTQQTLHPEIASIIETVHEDGSLTIQKLLLRLLERVSKGITMLDQKAGSDSEAEDETQESDDDAYSMSDYDMDGIELFGVEPVGQTLDRNILQRDFNEIVAHGYNPGFIQFGTDDFITSISIPVKSLAETISARALVAWDRRLLERSQHLTLLISRLHGVYPAVKSDGMLTHTAIARGVMPHFRIGLTSRYKPTADDAAEVLRRFGLQEGYGLADEDRASEDVQDDVFYNDDDFAPDEPEPEAEENNSPDSRTTPDFRPFSLSSSLESLLDGHFIQILRLRIEHGLGWAGAEFLRWEIEASQKPAEEILAKRSEEIRAVDDADAALSDSYNLPADCLLERNSQDSINLPLVAFSYLLRRLTLCPRYCLVCHQQLKDELDALKPYVCSSPLCTYQYYNLNRGPSLEYEICSNPAVVDLLVSLAYVAAVEGSLDAPLPVGMGLRVKCKALMLGQYDDPNKLYDFDALDLQNMRTAISALIDMLPPIVEMKRYLEQPLRSGRARPRLKDMSPSISEDAWLVLRWIVASCTAYLEELQSDGEKVKNMDPAWRQFRFSVGAPDAEAKFRKAIRMAKKEDQRAQQFPSLFAWHGSPAKNWHSIIRHGLWFKTITHGRAYGHGVYFAKDGTVSTGGYAAAATSCWRNSAVRANSCVALAEIVNLPSKFVSTSPYFVVDKTEWIVCRYLMVRSSSTSAPTTAPLPAVPVPPTLGRVLGAADGINEEPIMQDDIPYVPLDPMHPLTLSQAMIRIPEPSYALEKLLAALQDDFVPVEFDREDVLVLAGREPDDPSLDSETAPEKRNNVAGDWEHDPEWVKQATEHLMPPPIESSPSASSALQRELRSMLKEQRSARSLRELGWYMPEELIGDNLYQWIVELHSFDESIPIARDLKANHINSLVFEIRFPPTFPHSPPFFRILKPRFLPFIQGGGGHVTGGGSMCMDLLTADGWLPSYNISSVLLQIKLAISNLDPRPARLSQDWSRPYGMHEAIEGYKRAATHHGWKIPQELDKLTR